MTTSLPELFSKNNKKITLHRFLEALILLDIREVFHMKLSIIVPVYNSEKYLEKCLNSISNQDLKDWECLLIDDGSTDKSGTICDFYALKDSRFKVIHKYNGGVSETRNLGLSLAKGEWIGFVDSDDWIDLDRYSYAISKAEEANVKIVKCSIQQIRKNGTTSIWSTPKGLYDITDRKILSSPSYDNSSSVANVFQGDFLRETHLKFRDCDYGEDWLFNVEAYTLAGKMYVLEEPFYHYQRHDESLSTTKVDPSRYIKMLNTLKSFCKEYENNENWKLFKDIVLENFYTRSSIKKLREGFIDYVVPFVDNSDPCWIEQYNKYSPSNILDMDSNGKERFRCNQQLFKYHFRGLAKQMPWIGVVHLLVASESQVPSWINRNTVHVITHDEFIDKEFLPTFNSSTIEMFLPKIRGLSERFIYGNDDFYYVYTLKDKFYFEGDKVKVKIEPHPIMEGEEIPIWKQTFMNAWNLINPDKFLDAKSRTYFVPSHIERGMLKSTLDKVWEMYSKEMKESCTRFRDKKNMNGYIYTFQPVKEGKYIDGVHSHRNFNSSVKENILRNAIQNPDKNKVIRSFVLNDTGDSKATEVLLEELGKLYPEKCKYEV